MTSSLSRAITIALFATLAVAGCKKKDATPTTAPAADTTASLPPASTPLPAPPAPAAGATTVSGVELGNAVGADNRVTTAMTTFGARDTIHASVTTTGAATPGKLIARWTFQDGQEVKRDTLDISGPGTYDFHIAKPDGWPVGRYKLELSLDGNVVQTRDFEVR
ncbi:MAG: hypothetical protein EPO46_08885 [Lysobacter sp.]|nr:MAG: hypothetical protein EPO46_08885 [Lysobacter sp.]